MMSVAQEMIVWITNIQGDKARVEERWGVVE